MAIERPERPQVELAEDVTVHRPWVVVSQPNADSRELVTVLAGPMDAKPEQYVQIIAIIVANVGQTFRMPLGEIMEQVNDRLRDVRYETHRRH